MKHKDRDLIKQITLDCIAQVTSPRFFASERGYGGELARHLGNALEPLGLFQTNAIIEQEAQKSWKKHKTGQRPDIIFHVPAEVSGASVFKNNFVAWALKVRATKKKAADDFNKLDAMFEKLGYPLGFFINIDSDDSMRHCYTGAHRKRLMCVGVYRDAKGQICAKVN